MDDRFYEALWRNLNELRFAISMRNCLNELVRVAPETNWGFFSYCYLALFNDIFSHVIKVLDRHKDAASFWYLRNCETKLVDDLALKHGLNIMEIEELCDKLALVRDKTHFHIDKKRVMDSSQVWKDAGIKGDYINRLIDKIWDILNDLFRAKYRGDFGQPIHDGKDVESIIRKCKESGILV
jgi:hypothetical protein